MMSLPSFEPLMVCACSRCVVRPGNGCMSFPWPVSCPCFLLSSSQDSLDIWAGALQWCFAVKEGVK